MEIRINFNNYDLTAIVLIETDQAVAGAVAERLIVVEPPPSGPITSLTI